MPYDVAYNINYGNFSINTFGHTRLKAIFAFFVRCDYFREENTCPNGHRGAGILPVVMIDML